MDRYLHEILDAFLAFMVGLVPAALGAAVSLAYEKGLTWGDRFMRLAVGVIVSWFTSRAVGAMTSLDPFVLQAISFTIGMIAFKATPAFITSASATVAELPGALRDRFFPTRKGDGK